jgi:hypothetical protein
MCGITNRIFYLWWRLSEIFDVTDLACYSTFPMMWHSKICGCTHVLENVEVLACAHAFLYVCVCIYIYIYTHTQILHDNCDGQIQESYLATAGAQLFCYVWSLHYLPPFLLSHLQEGHRVKVTCTCVCIKHNAFYPHCTQGAPATNIYIIYWNLYIGCGFPALQCLVLCACVFKSSKTMPHRKKRMSTWNQFCHCELTRDVIMMHMLSQVSE